MLSKIAGFAKANETIAIWFSVTLSFFLAQHVGFSWDFAVHSLNAQYMLGQGTYFEWLRPPLPSALMAAFGFLGAKLAEYAYIIAVSVLYLYSSLKFSGKFNLDPKYYYIFSLSAFSVIFSFSMGTELLSLALLQLSLAYLHEKRGGIYLGMAVLARYSNLPYLLLTFFQKNIRKIATTFLLAFAVAVPWLVYSYVMAGNPLASPLDNYLLNIYSRQVLSQPIGLIDIAIAVNIVLPFFLLGLRKDRHTALMLSTLALTILLYFLTPLKEPRYLFPLAIPMAYFSTRWIENRKDRKNIMAGFTVCSVALILAISPLFALEDDGFYKNLATRMDNCMIASNVWVPFNYYGRQAEPLVYTDIPGNVRLQTDIDEKIREGYRVVIFSSVRDPFASYNRSDFVIEDNKVYVILGNISLCKPPQAYSRTYVSRLQELAKQQGKELECFAWCRIG